MNPVFSGDGTSRLIVGWFGSPPAPAPTGTRHANGQLLVCTDGVGLVGTRDGHDRRAARRGKRVDPGRRGTLPRRHRRQHDVPLRDPRRRRRRRGHHLARTGHRPAVHRRLTPRRRSDVMPISDAATANHDELFGDRVSTLAQTDPELIEYFDNFAFDEVLRADRATRRPPDPADGPARGADRRPAVAEFRVWPAPRWHGRRHPGRAQGDRLPGRARTSAWPACSTSCTRPTTCSPSAASSCRCPGSPRPPGDPRASAGARSRSRSSAPTASTPMYANAPPTSSTSSGTCPATASATTSPAPGIDLPTRELLTFAMLVALGGCRRPGPRATSPRTSTSATTGARLIDVLTQLLPFIGYPRTLNALAAHRRDRAA